ncbi:MAG: hypothetical protein ABR915_11095 [Thermoguttaceae bacterium]
MAVALLLAFLAGRAEAAHHQMEHCGDAAHDSGGCSLCMFAEQTAVTAGEPPPLIDTGAVADLVVAERPAIAPSPCHSAFRPRSPPA